MSEGTEELYSAIEESARLVGGTCSREMIWPTLTAYGDALDESGIVLSVQTGGHHAFELEYTMQVPAWIDDPYAHVLSNGFVARTDHPVGSLLSELRDRVLIDTYGVDYGIATGFKKVYALFARNPLGVATLAGIPAMPRALADSTGFLAAHGLDTATVIGIDYQRRTMNIYFQLSGAGSLEPAAVRSMLRGIGLAESDEQMLTFACNAYRIYTTLDWDSPTIQRISFAPPPRRGLDLSTLPRRLEPEIEQFMKGAPYTYDGERVCASVVKWSSDGAFLDLGSYYRISPMQLKALMAADK
jgi:hypothetical protein